MVCRAFVHAYRIMATIIEHDGHNHWLVDGTPHCNVRRDTKHGIVRARLGKDKSFGRKEVVFN